MLAMMGSVMMAASSRPCLLGCFRVRRGHSRERAYSSKIDGGMPSESGICAGFSGGPSCSVGWLWAVKQIGIVPAVIVAFELQELRAVRCGRGPGARPAWSLRCRCWRSARTSADGTMRRKRSAASTSADVAAAKCEPSAMACETTSTIFGCAWP